MPGVVSNKETPKSTFTDTTAPDKVTTKTSTPIVSGVSTPEITVTPNLCAGVDGSLEIQILVGPAEAVGMEPFSIGEIPFSITSQDPSWIQGNTHLSYDHMMTYSWGTYTVTLEMDANLTGECVVTEGDNSLHMTIDLSGNQEVVVVYNQTTHTYPWNGTATINQSFPIQDGAITQGEGWIFILHLNSS
jgi:hypothetical protein